MALCAIIGAVVVAVVLVDVKVFVESVVKNEKVIVAEEEVVVAVIAVAAGAEAAGAVAVAAVSRRRPLTNHISSHCIY